MDPAGRGELVFENGGGNLLDSSSMGIIEPLRSEKVPGINIGPEPMYKPYNGVNSFFNGCWDPLVSQGQNAELRASPTLSASYDQVNCFSYTGILENQGAGGTSQLVQHQSDHSPNLPHFLTRSFSEINSSFTLHNWHQFANSSQASDYPLEGSGNKKELTSQSAAYNCANLQNEFQISNEGTMEPSPKGKKRRRVSENHSEFAGLKNMNTAQENDECTGEQNDEKQKPEQKPVANVLGKLAAKEIKDNSSGGKAPKENYVHVRGKRGQVTNSHSLAERVRRERISERMKFLQELVPGCSKITGKAVMLDEIINYVLSLQWQVKFLSMKLSHVYPEMNVDIERMLSRNIHHSQGGSSASLGDPEMSSSYHIPKEIFLGALPATPSSTRKPPTTSQIASIWHNKLQSGSQMDFISNPVPE